MELGEEQPAYTLEPLEDPVPDKGPYEGVPGGTPFDPVEDPAPSEVAA
jgi:hypothetical protein